MPAHLRLGKGTAASFARPWFAHCEARAKGGKQEGAEACGECEACDGIEEGRDRTGEKEVDKSSDFTNR